MKPTQIDGIMLIYNYALLLTGGWLVLEAGIDDKWTLFGILIVPTLIFSIYFHYAMKPRFTRALRPSDDDDETDDHGFWPFHW